MSNCFEIHALLYKLWSGQMGTDAQMHRRMQAHTPNKNCNNYVSLTSERAGQKFANSLQPVEQNIMYIFIS